MARITAEARTALVEHCRSALPNEGCGYLVGDPDSMAIDRFVALANAAASPTRFRFDPAEQLAAERELDERGRTVVGVAHSHPSGDNAPSAVDIGDAAHFDPFGRWLHLVVRPVDGSVRAFRIVDGAAIELALRIG